MSDDEDVLCCEQCDDIFLSKSGLAKHIKEKHETFNEHRSVGAGGVGSAGGAVAVAVLELVNVMIAGQKEGAEAEE